MDGRLKPSIQYNYIVALYRDKLEWQVVHWFYHIGQIAIVWFVCGCAEIGRLRLSKVILIAAAVVITPSAK